MITMGLFDGMMNEMTARKAYKAHVTGNQLSEKGKPEEARAEHEKALTFYKQAIDAGVNKPVYLMAYGVLLLRFRRYEEAKELFLKAEKSREITKPERAQLRINFAICQWKLGNLDSAIEQLKIAKDSNASGTIYGSLGYILIEKARQTGDFAEALAFNQEALEYDDEDAVVLDNMGQLHLAMGDKEKALEYFTKAHEQKPAQVDTLYYLALLASERGEKDQAREYLESALTGNYSALCTTTREQAQELLASIK